MREPRKIHSVMRSKLARSGERITEALREVDHRLQAEGDGARLVVLPVLVAEHGTGDVEVGPGDLARHELAQEQAGRDRARKPPGGDVVEVRERRLQGLLVLLDERQLPERLAVVLAGALHAPDQLAVAA